VYEGDNRSTINEENTSLHDVADRVSLGLLPSSVEGWPLAAYALKATGGVLHVHENVHENIIDSWVADACATFMKLFEERGRPMRVECYHVERVKSYAPRVIHIVADLKCFPL
jgi:tRNA wybutosine-synthesizing protein 3